MAALQWAPPAPPRSAVSTPAPSTDEDPLSSAEGELALFRALVHHRLVGPAKHWDMVGVLHHLRAYPALSATDVWSKWSELYDPRTLDQVWDEQQEQLLPSPGSTPSPSPSSPAPPPQPASSSRGATPAAGSSSRASTAAPSARDPALARRIARAFFPPRDFSLLPPTPTPASGEGVSGVDLAPLARAAFERGRLPPGAPRESPVPEDAPLRAVSVPLAGGEGGRSPRKRAAAAGGAASPRKKAREEGEESELSELSDEEGSEGEGEEEEGASAAAGEDGEEEVSGTEDEEEEDDDAESGSDGAPKGKRGRATASSTKRARSAAASSPAPASTAKGTRAGTAAAAKQKQAQAKEEAEERKGTQGGRRGKKRR